MRAGSMERMASSSLPLAGRIFTFEIVSGIWTAGASFTQDTPGVPGASESGDAFGGSLAAGNFNGDLYDDLAIGAPWEDVGVTDRAGAVNLLYGSMLGLSVDGAQIWYRSGGGIDGTAAFVSARRQGHLVPDPRLLHGRLGCGSGRSP